MSTETRVIDRIFSRLTATYGDDFSRMWSAAADPSKAAEVKSIWANELAPFMATRERMECIAWALENLPERCPNLIQFRNLCRQAPRQQAPALPAPTPDPARVAAELAKLGAVARSTPAEIDCKGWARKIVAAALSGQRLHHVNVRYACEALRMPYPPTKATAENA